MPEDPINGVELFWESSGNSGPAVDLDKLAEFPGGNLLNTGEYSPEFYSVMRTK